MAEVMKARPALVGREPVADLERNYFRFRYDVCYLVFKIVRLKYELGQVDNRRLNRWLEQVVFGNRGQSDFWKRRDSHTRHNWRAGFSRPC